MSYNIDSIDYISGELYMSQAARRSAEAAFDLPEICFLNESDGDDCFRGDAIEKLWWSGSGSGRTFKHLKKVLAQTTGSADLLLTWEGGDSHTGLRVVDGVVTEHEVGFCLL